MGEFLFELTVWMIFEGIPGVIVVGIIRKSQEKRERWPIVDQ